MTRRNEVVKGKKLKNRDLEIVEFFQSLQDKLRVVVEAGSNWMWMTDLLDNYGIEDEPWYTFKVEN